MSKTLTFIIIICLQVLNHLHKKLKNVSKKSELSKKKVSGFISFCLDLSVQVSSICSKVK